MENDEIKFVGPGFEFKPDDDDNMYSIHRRFIAKVVDCEEKSVKQAIIDYAKEKYKGEVVNLWLIDKDTADEIIDLGIKEFARRHNNG